MSRIDNDYPLARGDEERSRLDAQHANWIKTFGYVIHPAAKSKLPSQPRIADIGCGSGVWLSEVSETLPDAELYGFDISSESFPDAEGRPASLKLDLLDAKRPIPAELESTFDLVHLRLLFTAMKPDEWASVSENMIKLLKPGGVIQWEEAYPQSWRIFREHAAGCDRKHAACRELCDAFLKNIEERVAGFQVDTLPKAWQGFGLTNIIVDTISSDRDPSMRKFLAQTSFEGQLGWAKAKAASASGDEFWTEEQVEEMERQVRQEIAEGWYLRSDLLCAVGWKP